MKLKTVLLGLGVICAAAVILIFGWFWSCQGQMQACYRSFRDATSGADTMTLRRQRLIHSGFAASSRSVAFAMPLESGLDGVVVIDRATGRPSLIAPPNYTHWAPHFSPDGTRLLVLRQQVGNPERQVLSCQVDGWRCRVLFSTRLQMASVADGGTGSAIVAIDARHAEDNERRRRFDLFAVRPRQEPVRLTQYETYGMSSISLSDSKIAFAAIGGQSSSGGACQAANRLQCDESHIFALDFDRAAMVLRHRPTSLTPLFVAPGYSSTPSLSADGKRIAFLNTLKRGNPWRYNMLVSNLDGVVEQEVPVEGFAFSSAAFVGSTLLINELLADRYRVKTLNMDSKQIAEMPLPFPASSGEMQQITLTLLD